MRFDDMLTTVMAAPKADAVSRQIVWRQLVDILAQTCRQVDPVMRAKCFASLDEMRKEVAPAVRAAVARSVARHTTAPDLVGYFAQDDPGVAVEMLRHARLSAAQWIALISTMPPASRSVLRSRRDLPDGVAAALAVYGSADFTLAPPLAIENNDAPSAGATPIADIVARIEAFRAQKSRDEAVAPSPLALTGFTFETDAVGVINYTSAVPREVIIGLSLAAAGEEWLSGVDGHAAGAFRDRSVFRGARLTIGGHSGCGGDWTIDGDPIFDATSGHFLGYRGRARRPLPNERAAQADTVVAIGDNVRQLVHELRTPLNAIIGFAEMIERQLLGPVDGAYRLRAAKIFTDGLRLVSAIEDIDLAARLDHDAAHVRSADVVDLAALLTMVGREMRVLTDLRDVHLRIVRPTETINVKADRAAIHRLLTRLIGMMLGLCEHGSTLNVVVYHNDSQVSVSVERPSRLHDWSERDLLTCGQEFDNDDESPLLGLGFGLRLLNSLAESMHVKFRITDQAFVLILRTQQDSAHPQRIAPNHDDERLPS